MNKGRKPWLQRFMQWLLRQLHRIANRSSFIFQIVSGSRNQTIAEMRDRSIAIANLDQLIQHFHLSPQEIRALETFWADWSQETDPPLSPNLVIGGRAAAEQRVQAWLSGNPAALTVQADSPDEAIAFLAAVVQTLEEPERTAVLSRAIVVDGATAWQSLISSSDALILIPRLNQPEGIGRSIQNGHHIFVPIGRMGAMDAVSLPRINRDSAERSLKEMGLTDNQAREFATLARRSLPALRRKLAIAPDTLRPAWAQPDTARQLLAPLLVGAWHDSWEGDRNILAQLSGRSYEQLQEILVRWANEPDPPLRRVGDVWMIAAQENTWWLIAGFLTDDDLDRFQSVAIEVLSELDPAFELPPERRFAAGIYGKVLPHSKELRNGIAETLALMATLSSAVPFMANTDGEQVARSIVYQLLATAPEERTLWASLAPQLPLLAEAAPYTFLAAVAAGLGGEQPVLVSLFQDKGPNAVMTFSPHTGLLWALETLAWNPDYLSQSALCLARLTRLDPGGQYANRPLNSLEDIFICWHPNTAASLDRRLRVLDAIRKQEPEVAWKLLLALLPTFHDSVSPTHGTKWRDWVPDPRLPITDQEYFQATTAVLNRLLEDAQANANHWCDLISHAHSLFPEQREVLIQKLETLDPQQFSSRDRTQICDRLLRETIDQRDYQNAEWSMPIGHIERLEAICIQFEPQDVVERHQWLFKIAAKFPGQLRLSWEEREKFIQKRRADVLQEILATQGWDGVLQLAAHIQEPGTVGVALSRGNLLPIDLGTFLQENLASTELWRHQMAQRFVAVSAHQQGEQWIEHCLHSYSETWTPEQYGEFLLYLPFNAALRDRLDTVSEEIQRYFWTRVSHVNLLDHSHADQVITNLLKVARPHLAIDAIQWANQQTFGIVPPERMAEVLEVAIKTPPGLGFDARSFSYASAKLLDYLETTDLPHDRLARLELIYFRIHDHHRCPHVLHQELAHNPELFVELLKYIYRAENQSEIEVSEETSALAVLAFKLLDSWHTLPGSQNIDTIAHTVDAKTLQDWVFQARELAASCDRTKVADIHIGQILAFSPLDPDGAWPHTAVRELIQELENSTIERGFSIQKFNNRGITTRLPTEGGDQERELVEQYKTWANQLSDQYPRMATVLRDMAETYKSQADQEDLRAELVQDFW